MITITEWLKNISENYSVTHFNDVESGTFVSRIKGDIYLMDYSEVREK